MKAGNLCYTDNGSEIISGPLSFYYDNLEVFMIDNRDGQAYLDAVLEKIRQRILSINESLLEGQKEIDDMHEYYWQNYTEMDEYGYENFDNQQALLHQINANQEQLILKHRFRYFLVSTNSIFRHAWTKLR